MTIRPFILICLSLFWACTAWGQHFEEWVADGRQGGDDTFFERFPYDAYLQEFSIEDIERLEQHQVYLDSLGLEGEQFLFKLYERFVETNLTDVTNFSNLNRQVDLGALMVQTDAERPDSVFVYFALKDLLFSSLATAVEQQIQEGKLKARKPEVAALLNRLATYDYYINVPTSNVTKFWNYAKAGKFGYIWHKAKTTYRTEFILAFTIGLTFLALIVWWLNRWRRRRRVGSQMPAKLT